MDNNLNKALAELLVGIGAITEMWMVTYKAFLAQGMDKDEALQHTTAMTKLMMELGRQSKEEE